MNLPTCRLREVRPAGGRAPWWPLLVPDDGPI